MSSGGQRPYRSYTPAVEYTADARALPRTPSPSPSEVSALKQTSIVDFKPFFKRENVFTKKYLLYYTIAIVALVITILFVVYDKQIVHAVQPAAVWMHGLPFGWLIPIAIFFVISFPPLFGHEILAVVVGVVWGVWIGFGITAAGTLLGEIGNFYAFRYLFSGYALKKEKANIQYACISKLVREGGFKIALIARYSAIPGHFTTAIFAVCGMNIFVFIAAALLSMPKQFITVYIGTLLEENATGTANTRDKVLSYVVAAITIIVTILAMRYIQKGVNRVKPDVIYARRKARQAGSTATNGIYQNVSGASASEDAVFNPMASEVSLNPSDTPYDPYYQRWDKHGHAEDVRTPMHAPQPRRASGIPDANIAAIRAESITPTGPKHQESIDVVGWDLTSNGAKAQQDSYPMRSIRESEQFEALRNPFEIDEDSETAIPPISSHEPPRRTSDGGHGTSLPQRNLGDAAPSTRIKSPPPYLG